MGKYQHAISIISHADWSVSAKKRVISYARLQENGRYRVFAPELVGDASTLLGRIRNKIGQKTCALVGFDFPIGFPIRYAEKSGIEDTIETLPLLGKGEWQEFYRVAETPKEISIYRPFYPSKPGNACHEHLLNALGFTNTNELRRACELRTSTRRAAAPLFWTLGAQQAGKAAMVGWCDVLKQCLLEDPPGAAIWPFSGNFYDLIKEYQIIIVETYPAEFYIHLGIAGTIANRGGKRSRSVRARCAPILLNWALVNDVEIDNELEIIITDGFGPSAFKDDGFDAMVGVLGMLNVIKGERFPDPPVSEAVRKIEGWIFGQVTK